MRIPRVYGMSNQISDAVNCRTGLVLSRFQRFFAGNQRNKPLAKLLPWNSHIHRVVFPSSYRHHSPCHRLEVQERSKIKCEAVPSSFAKAERPQHSLNSIVSPWRFMQKFLHGTKTEKAWGFVREVDVADSL